MKTIVFVGAGNVATHLAKELFLRRYRVLQIYSRTELSASKLAKAVNASFTTSIKDINAEADFYLFSVKDSILESLIADMPANNGIWIHTAGSMPIDIFEKKVKSYGVLYPLQTFSKEKKLEWNNIPLLIEASSDEVYQTIRLLANTLSQKIYQLSSDKRRYVHASGVFACNFANHMYDLAYKMNEKSGLPFEILLPLIDETAQKVHQLHPHEAQTGPAVRFDENVMNKHLQLIDDDTTKQIYKLLSESIYKNCK